MTSPPPAGIAPQPLVMPEASLPHHPFTPWGTQLGLQRQQLKDKIGVWQAWASARHFCLAWGVPIP